MSRKAKGQQVGAQLFPFLAVLICTMGALIVLLVLFVQQAHVDASALAAARIGGQTGGDGRRLRERLEDAQWQRELLEKSRAEKTEELTQTRSRVAHLEEHTQRLAAQAKELLERAKAIDEGKKLREEDMAAARAEAAKLKAEIDKKKEELEKAKKKPQDGQEWYALIPYDGRAGTRRRPIYVECTEFGVIIQPEGILLRAEDFNGPLGPGNPLDSALRAIREHWEKTAGDKAAQPYPLIVVRPSGVVAFGAAKAAISAWDDEWGYELISDDKNLDFGPPDPVLNAALSKTVAVSRQRQAAIVAMMPRRYQGDEPLKSFAPEPTIGTGNSRYVGGAGGGTAGGSGLGSNLGSGPGGTGFSGGGAGGQPGGGSMARTGSGYGNGLGTGTGAGSGNGSALGTGFGGAAGGQVAGTGRGGTGAYGTGGYGATGTGGYGATGTGGYGAGSGAGASGNGVAGGAGVGGNGMGGNGAGGGGIPSVTAGLNGGSTGQSDNLVGRNAASGVGSTGGGAGGDAFPGSGVNGGGAGSGGSSYGTGGGSGGSGQAGTSGSGQAGGGQFGSASGGQSFAGAGSGGQSGSSMGDSSSGGGSSFGSTGSASGGGGSPFGGSSMSGGSPGGMGVPSLNFGGAKSAPSSPSGGKSGSGGPSSTAKRGKNWGLPQAKVNQTGVTRHIRVTLQPDRVVMLPEAGDSRAPQVVKIAPELTPDDVTHFVTAVQNEVKGWGLAVADGYWKPVLQVDVAPGAERQYLNLETALNGSGIDIMRR